MKTLKRTVLTAINNVYREYKLSVLTKNVVNLPEYFKTVNFILLDVGEYFPVPTRIKITEEAIFITASFNRQPMRLEIPYSSLQGILNFSATEGVSFVSAQHSIEDPIPEELPKKPHLTLIN